MRLTLPMFIAAALGATNAFAQANVTLQPAVLRQLAHQCVRKVHPDTIEAVVRQESAYYPYSLSINYPTTEAKRMGYAHAQYQLARQPKSKHEAMLWAEWFLSHGHTVSIGLMQVSSEQAHQLGISNPLILFDPCVNLAAGAVVLQDSFRGQTPTPEGLAHAFALYNAGSITIGTQNGYAAGVLSKAPPLVMHRASVPESSPLTSAGQH